MQVNELINLPYTDGAQDCYGLVRQYYLKEYGIQLRNYARPIGFDHEGLDLIADNFRKEGFETLPTFSQHSLEKGDGILLRIAGGKAINHVGVYLGKGYFLHHLYGKLSEVSYFDPRWFARTIFVVRHPDIREANCKATKEVNLLDLLPPHLKERMGYGL
jgi:cell wall-associated NlpC family hydrolase